MHSSTLSKLFEEEEADDPDEPPAKKKVQTSITDFRRGAMQRPCSQATFEVHLRDFVVRGIHPFSIVENEDFKSMIKAIAPDKTVPSRKTLMKRISDEAGEQKKKLVNIISQLDHVSTTADSWKTFNRSFLGTTIHWLDPTTLARKSALLTCRRLIGSQTHDVLGLLLSEINSEFGIQNKIVCTTTDNGSNFVKAFRVYGQPETVPEPDDEEFVDVGDVLNTDDESLIALPNHERCAAHTLNLVATKDAEKAATGTAANALYRKKSRSTLALTQAIWNKQNSSSLHADVVREKCGIQLVTPNATRWNSLLDSMICLQKLLREKEEAVLQVCDRLGLARLKPDDKLFINEYCKVMKPVAAALDKLQGEKEAYTGILLPTLHSLRRRMEALQQRQELEICNPLVTAVISGIDSRFASQWFRKDLVLAAVLHPDFLFSWIMDEGKEALAREWLKEAVQSSTPPEPEEREENPSEEEESLFDFRRSNTMGTRQLNEFDRFVSAGPRNLVEMDKFPVCKKLFLRYNTAIPSSAGVERVFSAGGLIFSERRGKMSDDNFENCLRLKIGL